MSRIENERRIIKEEFKKEDRDTIDKLAFILNSFMRQVVDTINGKIDFNNLNQEVKSFSVTVDSNGTPISDLVIKYNLLNKIQGIKCINATNLTSSSTYVTGTPFLSYTPGEGNVTVNNITGLQANNKYYITLILIGNDV